MKKLTAIIIAAIMIFALVACTGNQGNAETGKATGGETESATVPATESAEPVESDEATETASDTGIDGVPNPIEEVGSAEDFEAIGITNLHTPDSAENVKYSIIDDKVAQIDFAYYGVEYCLRAAKTEDDISGLYGDTVSEKELSGGGTLTEIADGEKTYFKVEWKRNGVSFSLANVEGSSEDQLRELFEEIRYK